MNDCYVQDVNIIFIHDKLKIFIRVVSYDFNLQAHVDDSKRHLCSICSEFAISKPCAICTIENRIHKSGPNLIKAEITYEYK